MSVSWDRVLVACVSATVATLTVSTRTTRSQSAHVQQRWEGEKPIATWYVSASAQPGGNGSRKRPFESLIFVQGWSAPGDTILILPPPLDPPLTSRAHR
jgi:hypothetical protein